MIMFSVKRKKMLQIQSQSSDPVRVWVFPLVTDWEMGLGLRKLKFRCNHIIIALFVQWRSVTDVDTSAN